MHLKILLSIILSSILSLAAQAQNSSKYLKSIGQEGYTLYFVKPIIFKEGKARLIPDFTFQYQKSVPKTVNLKFSLYTKDTFREMEQLSFYSEGSLLGQSSGSELMYLEKAKGRWHARFSTTIPYSTLLDMLKAGKMLEIRFQGQNETLSFPAGRKWEKASAVIREILWAEIRE